MLKDSLSKSFSIKNLKLANRIVMAPMTRSQSPQHVPGKNVAEYYRRRTQGGAGLIITEGTAINHPASHGYPDVPNIFGEKALAGWKHVVDEVHAAGGKIFPQLWHVGSVRQKNDHRNQGVDNPKHCCHCNHPEVPGFGPSSIKHPYVQHAEAPKKLHLKDIEALINAYATAASDAKRIGFDGIELHGAHGYLIDQFFWDLTNQRTDHYGGKTLMERTRFAVDVIQAVRAAVGKNFPISFRMSQWKLGDYDAKMAETSQELESFLSPLVDAGVDIFHCSTRRFFDPEFTDSTLNLAGWVKKLTGIPTITVGSVGLDQDFIATRSGKAAQISENSFDNLLERLECKEFDLVAIGRMLLSNPDWANKVLNDKHQELIPFSKKYLEELY